jgi:transcriptional regulator with XRE-family HTH domain
MISSLVRRHRLALELTRLREEHGYSSGKLASSIGLARQRISRLENGHIAPDLDEIERILRLFNVDHARSTMITTIAREAQEKGWWVRYADQMGTRQARFADLEAGASRIREYNMVFLPGLLQIPAYTEARARIDRATLSAVYDPARALEARAERQRIVERPDGPTHQVIIDELAIRRQAVPPDIAAAQVNHLVEAGHSRAHLTIRVLPLGAPIGNYAVPRSAFYVYEYPDPDDPVVVAVDTVTDDLVLTGSPDVDRYLDLYSAIQDAALSPADSLDFLMATTLRETSYTDDRT